MPTVTYNSETFTCTTALKGADYIHLLDSSGNMLVSFDGVVDFSGFSITDGAWATPTEEDLCPIAVIEDDGTIGKSSFKPSDITKAANVTLESLGAAPANHTHTPASIGAAALDSDGKVKAAQTCSTVKEVSAATYTLTAADAGKFLMTRNESESDQTYTIVVPDDTANTTFPVGTELEIMRYYPGTVTLVAGSETMLVYTGATLTAGNSLSIPERYGVVAIKKFMGDRWLVKGELE